MYKQLVWFNFMGATFTCTIGTLEKSNCTP